MRRNKWLTNKQKSYITCMAKHVNYNIFHLRFSLCSIVRWIHWLKAVIRVKTSGNPGFAHPDPNEVNPARYHRPSFMLQWSGPPLSPYKFRNRHLSYILKLTARELQWDLNRKHSNGELIWIERSFLGMLWGLLHVIITSGRHVPLSGPVSKPIYS